MALFDQLADRVAAALWNLHPWWAVCLGVHEYDGQVPSYSAGALEAAHERLGRLRGALASAEGLGREQELDRAVLLAAIDRESPTHGGRPGPAAYLEPLAAVDDYLSRDYAPPGLRVEKAVGILEQAAGILAAARANSAPLPSAAEVSVARRRAAALAAWLEAGAAAADVLPPAEAGWLRSAAEGAGADVRAHGEWLRGQPVSEEGLPLGAREEHMARVELFEEPPSVWADRGRASLDRDGAALAEADVGEPEPEPFPPAAAVSAAAVSAALADALGWAARVGLVHALPEVDLRISEGLSPFGEPFVLQAPGPFDRPFPLVLRVDPRGTEDPAAYAADVAARLIAGRALGAAPTPTRRRFPSPAFVEGFCLDFGEALWEAGFGRDAPGWRRAWLRRAVRHDCRLIAAAGLANGDVGPQLERLFAEAAGCDAATARREAEQAVADPAVGGAALVRLVIRDRRRDWATSRGGLAGFYDDLLARGLLPGGLLR